MEKVSEIMSKNPIAVRVPGTRMDVLRTLVKYNVTGVPVVDRENKLVGMVSRRDIFENPDEEQLALLMRKDVPVVNENDTIEYAAEVMIRYGRRHIIVVNENKKVTGVITPQDFLKVIIKRKIGTPVENLVTKPCLPIYVKTPLPVVFKSMSLTSLPAFPVVDDEAKLVGIVTDRDLFARAKIDKNLAMSELGLGEDEDMWNWEGLKNVMKLFYMVEKVDLPPVPVEKVMIPNPITIFEKSPAWEAAKIMKKNNFSQLPVRNTHDDLQAMIFDSDLVSSLLGVD